MKLKSVVLIIGLALFLFEGCVPSLHPLYTKDKLTMHKSIPGSWVDSDGAENDLSEWHFVANKDQSYNLIQYDSNGQPGTFDVHLVKLGGDYFFNFSARPPTKEEKEAHPKLRDDCMNEFESIHYYPVNTFAKASFENDQISISFFDGEFLRNLLEQNRIRIKHEKIDSDYVLTASSEELQKFVVKYSNDPKAFPDTSTLKRK